jgi:hypothetical protein
MLSSMGAGTPQPDYYSFHDYNWSYATPENTNYTNFYDDLDAYAAKVGKEVIISEMGMLLHNPSTPTPTPNATRIAQNEEQKLIHLSTQVAGMPRHKGLFAMLWYTIGGNNWEHSDLVSDGSTTSYCKWAESLGGYVPELCETEESEGRGEGGEPEATAAPQPYPSPNPYP